MNTDELLDKIRAELTEAVEGYIGDTITPLMEHMMLAEQAQLLNRLEAPGAVASQEDWIEAPLSGNPPPAYGTDDDLCWRVNAIDARRQPPPPPTPPPADRMVDDIRERAREFYAHGIVSEAPQPTNAELEGIIARRLQEAEQQWSFNVDGQRIRIRFRADSKEPSLFDCIKEVRW